MFDIIAGLPHARLLLFFLFVAVLVACAQPVLLKQTLVFGFVSAIRWIQQHAIPLRTSEPGGNDDDLTPLKQMVGQASIVGLGEATHGTHEFIEMKARLVEFLVSKMGFTTFVMENDWGSSQQLDAYINGGPGSLKSVMEHNLFGFWQTQEYQALFEWMRTYNANPAHPAKLHFMGMDIQSLSPSEFSTVENYVQQVDPEQVATVHQFYAPLISTSSLASLRDYMGLDVSTKQQYQDQAQQVFTLLQTNQQRYIARSSPSQFALALQNARVIVQFTIYYNRSTHAEYLARFYQRDTVMAENVEWIYDHAAGSHPKLLVWAHDAHIANDTNYSNLDGKNLGAKLRARYHQNYLSIGTTLEQGTYRRYGYYPENSIQTIAPISFTTYNYTLGQAGLPLYLLDLRTIPSGAVSDWAKSSSTLVMYGMGGEDESAIVQLNQWFDVLIHIQTTTPSYYFHASLASE